MQNTQDPGSTSCVVWSREFGSGDKGRRSDGQDGSEDVAVDTGGQQAGETKK